MLKVTGKNLKNGLAYRLTDEDSISETPKGVLIKQFNIMKALNKKHQSTVNKAISWLTKHNLANNQRDEAEGNGDEKMYNKYNRICESTFDKYLDYTSELPLRELKQIEKSELY